jgi:hypothetical protein
VTAPVRSSDARSGSVRCSVEDLLLLCSPRLHAHLLQWCTAARAAWLHGPLPLLLCAHVAASRAAAAGLDGHQDGRHGTHGTFVDATTCSSATEQLPCTATDVSADLDVLGWQMFSTHATRFVPVSSALTGCGMPAASYTCGTPHIRDNSGASRRRALPAAQLAGARERAGEQRRCCERARREQRQQEDDKVLQLAPDELLVEVLEGHLARRVGLRVRHFEAGEAVREAEVAAIVQEGDLYHTL